MTFATPILAAIAAAIAIPSLVILYFLKLRRKSVEVSTTLLWKKSIDDLQANAPFQRLRRNILLLLQLLVLLAALLALAQPQSSAQAGAGTRHVFLVDRSASMKAIDGDAGAAGTTRLEAAKRRAIEEVRALREPSPIALGGDAARGDEAMIIAFDASAAEIVQRFTSDKNQLEAAIERIKPTDAPGAIAEAFRLAQAHRARRTVVDNAGGSADATTLEVEGQVGGPPQTFHLFSDGRITDLDRFLPRPDDGVVYHKVGLENAGNLAITGLRAERAYDRRTELSIFAGVQNASAVERAVDVELLLDGTPSAIRTIRVPGAEAEAGVRGDSEASEAARARAGTGGVVFELERADGAIATVRLRTGDLTGGEANPAVDALPVDDEAFLVIPPAQQTAVAVVTAGNFFLREALAGLPLARLETFAPSAFRALSEEERSGFDVFVLDGLLPPGTSDEGTLPEGRYLIFNAVPGPGLARTGEAGAGRFIDWERDHPVLRELTLDGVRIAEIRRVEVADDSPAEVLAETNMGPGVIDLATPAARSLVVPFDVADSNWPFDVSFVVFLASAIEYLGSDASARAAGGGARHPPPGSIFSDRLPPGASSVFISPPSGGNEPIEPGPDGRIVYGPIRETGVYTIEWSGGAAPTDVRDGGRVRRFFASSLLDGRESDVRAEAAAAIANRVVAAESGGVSERTRRYWPYLVLAALALLMFEWFIFNRKVYV